ncbi:type II toxin-antitoxin system prevent-host-death family antitoxin [Leekyejoonella antrihumi]|uniref:Type II toxin-antitoxin system prevent-host-death family antitoxin n=1 Tax=Leekyejoonella antrihumi TaxID=1660198 RepID=A0A563E290_9MICO|nr:type II toxin-antitoxin system prevent-host-death family antitoxin [Leekyejoonella antrihumi]TWP36657.1 type II toxin-antitoxin system prevent-host-death family antitoxin [Leekyejoonella antrihumi]
MRTTSKRELNQQTAAVLDKVTDTDDVVVTERGKPRWKVSAFRKSETALARLEREGRYTPPASEPAPWPASPGGPKYAPDEAEALIDEMRGDH